MPSFSSFPHFFWTPAVSLDNTGAICKFGCPENLHYVHQKEAKCIR